MNEELGFQGFDADNHREETADALVEYLPKRATDFVEVQGRTKIWSMARSARSASRRAGRNGRSSVWASTACRRSAKPVHPTLASSSRRVRATYLLDTGRRPEVARANRLRITGQPGP
jgi:hypothetical protein